MADRDKDRSAESRRILERVRLEADSGGGSLISRGMRRARNHMTASDADPEDRIEYWGTRIGRILGLIICIGLLAWLLMFVLRGA
ncbi:hypothetical protein [Pseudaminobacter sp. NGMCC 1.201702]|uniref:hypothetical protein n=1 Tax=Pseudaminobacter sp. NGMCC 1.201702 TaxID=3391825 RepID=UPI0039F04722